MRVIENNGQPDAGFSSAISEMPLICYAASGRTVFVDRLKQVAGWKVK